MTIRPAAAWAEEPGSIKAVMTVAALFAACAASLAVAFLNQPYFQFVNGVLGVEGEDARGVLFSSWLLLIGLPIVAVHPRAFGLALGSVAEHWRLVVATVAAAVAVTAAIILTVRPVPYSDASWFIEIVDVPVTEELVFRGVLLTVLLAVLRRLHAPGRAAALAIVFDGLAFGLAHAANATALDPGFVASQVTFAVVLGTGCAFLMARTGSLYPAILLHAAVNAVVVAA